MKDIMNASPRFVRDDTPVAEVIRLMEEGKINELPVVDDRRQVVGEINFLEITAEYPRRRKRLLGSDS